MVCMVCGGAYERRGTRGPIGKRCPACHYADRREGRKPVGRTPHPCADCGTETTRKKVCAACYAARGKELRLAWHKKHPGKALEAHRKHAAKFPWKFRKRFSVFGVTEEEFAELLAKQSSRCAICSGTDPGPGGWNLDHDHSYPPKDRTGHRGVLCRACNLMLGNSRDTESSLLSGAEYLKRHRAKVKVA
jgi:hypothetical protein